MIARRTLRHEIKDYLIEAIMSGELKPGERIIESHIAKNHQVSQAPVREAIRELEQMNLIETVPHQGAFVKKLSKDDMAESYILREALEGIAAQQAVEYITDEQLQILKRYVQRMEHYSDLGNVTEFIKNDIKFHMKIFEICGNKLLSKTYEVLTMNKLFILGTKLSNKTLKELAVRHKDIVESFEQRDGEQAEKTARQHIRELAVEVLKNMD